MRLNRGCGTDAEAVCYGKQEQVYERKGDVVSQDVPLVQFHGYKGNGVYEEYSGDEHV